MPHGQPSVAMIDESRTVSSNCAAQVLQASLSANVGLITVASSSSINNALGEALGGRGGFPLQQPSKGRPQSNQCASALNTADQTQAAVARAEAAWATLQAAAQAHNIDPALLAAVGVRESGFQNVTQIGGGQGVGIFQLTVAPGSGVTCAQASNLQFAANYAAGMLSANESVLGAEFPNFTSGQLLQATAASFNLGVGGISGNPATIDVGSAGNNYGSNVVGLTQCFK